jgi:uncharacterized protein (DUF2147 family)
MMKIKLLIILCFLFCAPFVRAQDTAKEIFIKATEVLASENIEMTISIDETNDKGQSKVKELIVLKGKFGDEEKTKVTWEKPERAKGTTVIITQLPSETGTIEVYTPSNEKTRKLKATDSNMKMIGTGFNTVDIVNYDAETLKYEMLKDTLVNGKVCHRIKVSGSSAEDNSSAILVIQKDLNYIVQITRFNEKNEALSLTKISDYNKVEGQSGKFYPMYIVTKDFENNKDLDIRILSARVRSDLTKTSFTL